MKSWLKGATVLVACTALMTASAPAIADTAEFGVLYIGNHSDEDAREVRRILLRHDWEQEVFKSSRDPSAEMQPTHHDFTDGRDGSQTEAGDDADLLYVSGHGWSRAMFPIYRYGVAGPVDSISPDTHCTNSSPWEVGVEWKGSYPSNESRWDNDIEWAVFAACSQLDWRTPPAAAAAFSTTNPRDSAAKTWARTLLGEPRRMHSILGYWGIAPSGTTDTAIARSFLYRALDLGHSVVSSWMEANQPYGVPWAVVTHSENRWDRLHGVGAGPRPDTRPDDPYHIDYYRYGLALRVMDGRGGSYEQMTEAGGSNGPLEWVLRWLNPETALGDPPLTLPHDAEAAGLKLSDKARARGEGYLGCSRPARPVRVDPRSLVPRASSIVFSPGASDTPREVRIGLEEGADGAESVVVWPSGLVEYHAGRMHAPVRNTTPSRAIAEAKRFLLDLGLLPDDSLVVDVWAVTRSGLGLDETGDENAVEEVLRYDVRFAQRMDGLLVDGIGSGITVSLDEEGVSDLTYLWHEAEGDRSGSPERPIPASVALSRMASAVGRELKMPEKAVVEHMDLVYRPVVQGRSAVQLRPAWRVGLEDGGCAYVDAETGQVFD